jgi:hypothetical protein
MKHLPTALVLALALALPLAVHATESGSGRPVAGTGVGPGAGLVPAGPLTMLSMGFQYVDGTLSAERRLPVAGRVVAGAENTYTLQSATLLKVWDTGKGPWNFASALTVLAMQSEVSVQAFVPAVADLARSSKVSGLFDIAVTPLVAGYHFSETEHVSVGLRVWVPTGEYVDGRLANLSQNVWTFVPTASYTRLLAGGIELSAAATLNIYSRNAATDYHSAPQYTLELLASRKFANGVALGGIAGVIGQFGPDSGPLADRLRGFRGSEVALGPIVTYGTKVTGVPVAAAFRWIKTVSNHDRLDRDTFYLTISLPLPI